MLPPIGRVKGLLPEPVGRPPVDPLPPIKGGVKGTKPDPDGVGEANVDPSAGVGVGIGVSVGVGVIVEVGVLVGSGVSATGVVVGITALGVGVIVDARLWGDGLS